MQLRSSEARAGKQQHNKDPSSMSLVSLAALHPRPKPPVPPPISRLPESLLAAILQHVPQKARLKQCARVCKAWKQAAAAATVNILQCRPPSAAVVSLQTWIRQHGKQLSCISLDLTQNTKYGQPIPPPLQLQLPCAVLLQLSSLHLSGMQPCLNSRARVPVRSAQTLPQYMTSTRSTNRTAAAILPMLKELRLSRCAISDSLASRLSELSGITFLALKSISFTPTAGAAGTASTASDCAGNNESPVKVMSELPQHMPQLARLQLVSYEPSADFMEAASSSLTFLSVSAALPRSTMPTLPPSLPQLAQLQHLKLEFAAFSPSALASMSQLKLLDLQICRLLPCTPDAACCFLEALGGMQKLQHMLLRDVTIRTGTQSRSALAAVDPQYLSALTVSTELTFLQIFSEMQRPLPHTAVQHMFPEGMQLPHLREVVLGYDVDCDESDQPFIAVSELQGLARACPALCSLQLGHAVEPGDLSGLLQLPASCQQLGVSGAAFDDEAAATLRQLTQLTSLCWNSSPDLTEAGLDQLTALQQLQHLNLFDNYGLCRILAPGWVNNPDFEDDPYMFATWEYRYNKSANKPVWQQLSELLDKSASCASWRKQVKELQQENVKLKQQLAQLQQAHGGPLP